VKPHPLDGSIAGQQPELMHKMAHQMAKELGADALVMFALNRDRTVAVAQFFVEGHAAYLTPHTVAHIVLTVGEQLHKQVVESKRQGNLN
jgi:hypothetical protein